MSNIPKYIYYFASPEGSPGLKDIIIRNAENISALEISDVLPRNSMGKILAQQLRDRFAWPENTGKMEASNDNKVVGQRF